MTNQTKAEIAAEFNGMMQTIIRDQNTHDRQYLGGKHQMKEDEVFFTEGEITDTEAANWNRISQKIDARLPEWHGDGIGQESDIDAARAALQDYKDDVFRDWADRLASGDCCDPDDGWDSNI